MRGWRTPGGIEDPGFPLRCHQNDSNRKSKPDALDGKLQLLQIDLLALQIFPQLSVSTVYAQIVKDFSMAARSLGGNAMEMPRVGQIRGRVKSYPGVL